MSVSAQEIAQVLEEIGPIVSGGWIQKVFQPAPRTVVLEIRTTRKTLSLLISVSTATGRIHLLTSKPANPPAPPAFCQYLRAHIQGARVDRLEQVNGDRIVRIMLTAREGGCALVAELTGRRTNLLLLDEENRVRTALDREREKIGQLYVPPPPPETAAPAPEDLPLSDPSRGKGEESASYPVSASIEARYRDREQEELHAFLRKTRLAAVRKGLKKIARRVDALTDDLEKAGRYKEYARYGELLKANLGLMKKGQDQIAVVDYYDPVLPELILPLDPSKGPQGNMDDYFKKHRKHLAAEREIRPRLQSAEKELDVLRKELTALQTGLWQPPTAPVFSIKRERKEPRHVRAQSSSSSGPFRRFASADGLPIYVGRNARENEELTFKFAHSDDLWLHARGTPGSHVVVRLEKGTEAPPETVRDAATLALLYSDLKKSGKGEVIYTRRKWVKKMKGQPAGTVSVTQEKSVYANLDRKRLDRLKESRER